MKWMRERDLLIAQTLAFVQSVTGKLPETDATTVTLVAETTAAAPSVAATSPAETPETIHAAPPLAEVGSAIVDVAPRPVEQTLPLPTVELLLPIEEAPPVVAHDEPKPAPVIDVFSPPDLRIDFQSEIRARVASFRAHQERFSREREAYCSTTMAKVHASIREIGPPTNSRE